MSGSSLPEEVILEILERLPPSPQVLARASAVCKGWRRVLSDPGFLLGRPAVAMGFFHNFGESARRFVAHAGHGPASFSFDVRGLRTPWTFLDCRHGRALLRHGGQNRFLVWHPMTGHRSLILARELNAAHGAPCEDDRFSAALLCGCRHGGGRRSCHASPFRVASLFNHGHSGSLRGSVFSSRTGRWVPSAGELPPTCVVRHVPGVAIGSTFYQPLHNYLVAAYDTEEQSLATFEQPEDCRCTNNNVRLFSFKAAGGGVLGIAGVQGFTLRLWAREEEEAWALRNTVDLTEVLPEVTLSIRQGFGPYFVPPVKIVGVAEEEGGALFLWSMVGVYTLCPESMELSKVLEVTNEDETVAMDTVYPYTASYLPAAATFAPPT